ncbi:hypothetical protein [Caminibacter sp.]
MKKILLIGLGLLFMGCSTKAVKKQNPSVEMQKQDAQKAWKELDKE